MDLCKAGDKVGQDQRLPEKWASRPSIQAKRIERVMSRMSSCIPNWSVLHPRDGLRHGKRAIRHMRKGCSQQCCYALSPFAVPAAAQSKINIEQNFADSPPQCRRKKLAVSGGFYVPAYSSVAMSQGKLRIDFSVTLSVHNASETQPLVIKTHRLFRHRRQAGRELSEGAGGLEAAGDRLGLHSHRRRTRRDRGQFPGRLGCDRGHRRARGRGLDGCGVANAHYAFISQGRPTRTVTRK